MTSVLSVADSILALALAEGPCPEPHPAVGTPILADGSSVTLYHFDGSSCTGRKAKYPTLRVPCIIGEHHDGYGEAWHGHYPDVHQDKDCPGWVPVSGAEATEALLEAVHSLGLIAIIKKGSVSLHKPNQDNDYCGEAEGYGNGLLLEALVGALTAAGGPR